jgi:hypothetical protein
MSLFDNVEVSFHGGPHEGTVSLSASEIGLNRTPMHSIVAEICSRWVAARREDAAFSGTILLLPAVALQEHVGRVVNHGQVPQASYRVSWADLRDDGTLKLILKYAGTTGVQEPTNQEPTNLEP